MGCAFFFCFRSAFLKLCQKPSLKAVLSQFIRAIFDKSMKCSSVKKVVPHDYLNVFRIVFGINYTFLCRKFENDCFTRIKLYFYSSIIATDTQRNCFLFHKKKGSVEFSLKSGKISNKCVIVQSEPIIYTLSRAIINNYSVGEFTS